MQQNPRMWTTAKVCSSCSRLQKRVAEPLIVPVALDPSLQGSCPQHSAVGFWVMGPVQKEHPSAWSLSSMVSPFHYGNSVAGLQDKHRRSGRNRLAKHWDHTAIVSALLGRTCYTWMMGGCRKRYKALLKQQLMQADINPQDWEILAADRSKWRNITFKASREFEWELPEQGINKRKNWLPKYPMTGTQPFPAPSALQVLGRPLQWLESLLPSTKSISLSFGHEKYDKINWLTCFPEHLCQSMGLPAEVFMAGDAVTIYRNFIPFIRVLSKCSDVVNCLV